MKCGEVLYFQFPKRVWNIYVPCLSDEIAKIQFRTQAQVKFVTCKRIIWTVRDIGTTVVEETSVKTHESEETYLETIYVLGKGGEAVRSVDVANELKYSRASISVAMKNLREKKLIEVGQNGHISLTDEGHAIATSMYERHTLISEWFVSLGVSREIAERDACKMEHSISDESFAAIKRHIEKS